MADGTFILGEKQSVKYRRVDKNTLSIDGFGGVALVYDFVVDKNQLTLKEGGELWIYKRALSGLGPAHRR